MKIYEGTLEGKIGESSRIHKVKEEKVVEEEIRPQDEG